jgi:hypothetical protein
VQVGETPRQMGGGANFAVDAALGLNQAVGIGHHLEGVAGRCAASPVTDLKLDRCASQVRGTRPGETRSLQPTPQAWVLAARRHLRTDHGPVVRAAEQPLSTDDRTPTHQYSGAAKRHRSMAPGGTQQITGMSVRLLGLNCLRKIRQRQKQRQRQRQRQLVRCVDGDDRA